MQNRFQHTALGALLLAITVFVVLPSTIVVLADPCHVFHRPIGGIFRHGFTYNQRCQNAGLINQYLAGNGGRSAAVLVGTSLSGNFLPSDITRAYDLQRALKLFLPDGRPAEQQATMEHALQNQSAKLAIWEILPQQYLLYGKDGMGKLVDSAIFPAYLYNRSRLDDYRYIFNQATLQATLDVLQQADIVNIPSIDMMGIWDHGCPTTRSCNPFHTAVDISDLRKDFKQPLHTLLRDAERATLDYSTVDQRLLSTLQRHCNTALRIDLFFPPLSYLWFSRQNSLEFHYHLYMLRYVTGKIATCDNIRVFAFNDEGWIAGDLAHYHDPRHFYGDVQRYIIESMASGKHVINTDNVAAYEKRFIDAVNNYQPWASTEEQMRQNARY